MPQPSLYEMLTGNFSGGLELNQIGEEKQLILSVLDNIQRILNSRAGSLSHLPDYGLPDMSTIMHGLPATSQKLMEVLSATLLKYEPRIKRLSLAVIPGAIPGQISYALEAELHEAGLVRYGTEFMPGGRVLIRHLKQQHYLKPMATW